jgi:hypothetical protein
VSIVFKVIAIILVTTIAVGCATTGQHGEYASTTQTNPDSPVPDPAPVKAAEPAKDPNKLSGWQIAGMILLLPIVVGVLVLAAAAESSSSSFTCRTTTYSNTTSTRCY